MADTETQLEQRVTEGWAFLAERGEDSSDPARPVDLAWRRGDIAIALFQLGRYSECLAVADGLVAYCTDANLADVDSDLPERWLPWALHLRSGALARLGRAREAAAVDAEIIVRFRDSVEPEVRRNVVTALGNRSRDLLGDPTTAAHGVDITDELLELLGAEPDGSLLPLAGSLLDVMSGLMSRGSGTGPLAAFILQGVLANGRTLARSAVARVPAGARTRLPAPRLAGRLPVGRLTARVEETLVPEPVRRIRRRLEQAARLGDALVRRLSGLEESEAGPLLARAELFNAACLGLLGHMSEASRRMDEMQARQDPDVAAAYAYAADNVDAPESLVSRLGATASLSMRARALVGDDPALARIAYLDSIAARIPGASRRPLRWVISYLTPRE